MVPPLAKLVPDPEAMMTDPDAPADVVPELNKIKPDAPVEAALADRMMIDPVVVLELSPDMITTDPPVLPTLDV